MKAPMDNYSDQTGGGSELDLLEGGSKGGLECRQWGFGGGRGGGWASQFYCEVPF